MKHELPVPVAGEMYEDTCERFMTSVKKIIESEDHSQEALVVLAYVLTNAPADFDYGASFRAFRKSREFLATLDDDARNFFRCECEKLPARYDIRIDYLLSQEQYT
jgi:hypothetical protein